MSGARLTWLVTRRELREGIRGKTFLVSSALMLLILVGIVALPSLLGSDASTVKLGVVGGASPRLVRALDAAAEPLGDTVDLRRYADVAAARDAVAHGTVDAALVADGPTLLVPASPSGDAVAIATAAVRATELPAQAERLGISEQQAQQLLAPPVALSEVAPASGADEESQAVAFISAVLLFVAVSIYGQAVLMGVVQEKASRIVEVLLAAVRPRHLLAGKVAGVGLLGLLQLAMLAVVAIVAGVTGAIDLPAIGRTVPLAVLWFLLGFAFYAVAFAAVGALVSRVEDASSGATPVTMVMIACYLLSFAALDDPGGRLADVLTLVPLSAPFTIPGRAAVTAIPLWEHALAVALMLAAIWAFVRLAGRVYEMGLLRSGPRVPFRDALRVALARR